MHKSYKMLKTRNIQSKATIPSKAIWRASRLLNNRSIRWQVTSRLTLFSIVLFAIQAVSKVPPRTTNSTPPNRIGAGTTGAVKKNDAAGAASNQQIEELSNQVRPEVVKKWPCCILYILFALISLYLGNGHASESRRFGEGTRLLLLQAARYRNSVSRNWCRGGCISCIPLIYYMFSAPNSCQEAEDADPAQLIQKILDILYATEVSERFIWNSATCIINVFWHHRMALRHQTMHHQRTKSTKCSQQLKMSPRLIVWCIHIFKT